MSTEVWSSLRSAGRLYIISDYRSVTFRAQVRRQAMQARRQGASWRDIAAASLLNRSTVRRLTRV